MITYFEKQLEEISHSIHSLDLEVFHQLLNESVDTLREGHKIIVSGLGKNVPICDKFVGSMVSMGLDAYFLHTNSAVHGDMGLVKNGDLVIILTKSGATAETVYLVELLRKREDVKLWLISFEQQSVLADTMENKILIQMEHEGDLWDIVPNNSTTLNLIVLQTVAVELSRRLHLDLERDFKPNHPGGAIGERLNHK